MSDRPGFMLYFDIRPALQRMNNEERGQWLAAVVDYAEFGVIPSELDNMAGMAFDMFRPRIDQDAKRYSDKVLQSKYAVYCREAQRHEETPCSFDEWLNNQAISDDNERYPTTTATTTTTANTNITPTPTDKTNSNVNGSGKGVQGEGETRPRTRAQQIAILEKMKFEGV